MGFVVSAFLVASAIDATWNRHHAVNGDDRQPGLIVDAPAGLRVRATARAWKQYVGTAQRAPLYAKWSIGDELLEYLRRGERCETDEYIWHESSHDLNQVAGRAADMIEALYGVKLPKVTPRTSRESLDDLHRQASASLAAYRTGAHAAMSELGARLSAEQVKQMYHGRIPPSTPRSRTNPFEGAQQFNLLLRDWFPIGQSLRHLEAVSGLTATKRSDGRYSVQFDNGYFGVDFLIEVDDDLRIKTIRCRSIN